MKINSVGIQNEGYVHCKSDFYTARDGLSNNVNYTFTLGANELLGEIDSGIWAISYLLSMYECQPEDFILFNQPIALVDNTVVHLREVSKISCYMDKSYPLFSTNTSINMLVNKGLMQNEVDYSANDIKDLFHIDQERFCRPLVGMGNEKFKAMAAIGYSWGKQIFCFPWMSDTRFKSYHLHLTDLIDVLCSLDKVIIVPKGKR